MVAAGDAAMMREDQIPCLRATRTPVDGTESSRHYRADHVSWLGVGAVVLAHGAVLAAFAVWADQARPALPAPALMVHLIATAATESADEAAARKPPPPPQDAPPGPKKPARTNTSPPSREPLMTAAPVAPAVPADTAPTPQPPVQPAPTELQATAQPAIAERTAAAATVIPPRFDAAYLQNPAPTYPPLSRRMGEEGRVILRVFVEPDGRPSQVDIRTGSGSPRLDQAALDAVRRWKFVAAKQGNEAVGAWVLVPIVFSLKN